MATQLKHLQTPEEYLAIERKAEYKSEFLQGEIFAMTGASIRHNTISGNVLSELKQRLRKTDCNAFGSDMRVGVPDVGLYTYPDVVAVCGKPVLQDEQMDTLLNPVLLLEVLSKSTATYDKTIKFGYYRTIQSLKEYVVVSQDAYHITQHVKQTDGRWLLTDIKGADGRMELSSVECALTLAEIYERVEMP